jgi:hypothetical protein
MSYPVLHDDLIPRCQKHQDTEDDGENVADFEV